MLAMEMLATSMDMLVSITESQSLHIYNSYNDQLVIFLPPSLARQFLKNDQWQFAKNKQKNPVFFLLATVYFIIITSYFIFQEHP